MNTEIQEYRYFSVLWPALLVVFLLFGFIFSIVQPLGRTPDERAHVQYIAFLANEHRLPLFNPQGGGEAGYEAQHPPLYYAAGAAVYSLSSALEENWRWYILRWGTLLAMGLPLCFVVRCYFAELWPQHSTQIIVATALVVLMPLTLLYVAYVNPDGLVLLWMALVLLDATRAARKPASTWLSVRLGLWCGLALLTKLSGFPSLLVAIGAHFMAGKNGLGKRFSLTSGVAALLALPWYARNVMLYDSPFIHTQGQYGTGIDNALRGGFDFFAWFTLRETFLSTWIQRGWLPDGLTAWLCYSFIIVSVVLAFIGLWQHRRQVNDETLRRALNLAALAIVFTLAGQQWAFWTQDVEFNAGGRYLLATMPAIILVLLVGIENWPRLRRIWAPAFLLLLMGMNLVSIWNITANLNLRYAPEWHLWKFVPGEEPHF